MIAWYISTQRKLKTHKHLLTKTTPHDKCPLSFNINSLVSCHDDEDRCNSCSEKGPRVCVEVTDERPYSYKLDSKSKVNVPNGKWCLPPIATDLQCNLLTGDPVLTKRGKNYIWRCQCKYPKLIDNEGVYGDCSEIAACGAKLVGSTNTLICPERSEICTPGQPWSENPTWDPTEAICRCGPNQIYIQQGENKLCVDDPCFPGKTDETNPNECICPHTTKDKDGNITSWVSHNNKCIQDPCNPSGEFDGRKCICSKPNTVAQLNPLSPIEWSCASPCDSLNNPCGSRGKCKVDKNGRAICSDCIFPNYQSDDKKCNNIVKPQYAKCSKDFECESNICSVACKTSGWGWVKHPVCCPNEFNAPS